MSSDGVSKHFAWGLWALSGRGLAQGFGQSGDQWKTDASCWTDTIFLENCCSVPEVNGTERGCWDGQFTFAKCCGGVVWQPRGYDAWLTSPMTSTSATSQDNFEYCAELARRFDFSEEYVEGGPIPVQWQRFRMCLRERQTLASSAYRSPILAGQHFPTLITPGPTGLIYALPAHDFVVSKAVKMYGTYDPEELRIYKRLLPEGGTLVDVGANIGSYSIPLARHVGRQGRVVAVEPFHSLFQILTANSAINGLRNLKTRQVGLGEKPEKLRAKGPNMEEFNNIGMARIFRPFEEKYAETFNYRSASNEETITVTTLDILVKEEELEQVSLLKVDVEGHLKAVLAGGQETLQRHRPIVVAEHSADDSFEILEKKHGYHCEEHLEEHDLWVCLPLAQ